MDNGSKQAITNAIDAAGFSWQVAETKPQPLVVDDKIIIEEIVTFIATKRTEIAKP